MTDAATQLAEMLRRENAALERHDLAAVGTQLADKQAAIQAFTDVPPGEKSSRARELIILAEANRRLLERAITVQQQVVGLVARAASACPTGRYDRQGAHTNTRGHAGARAYRASA